MQPPESYGDWFLIRPAEFSAELASGLRLPDIAKDKAWYGLVLDGPDDFMEKQALLSVNAYAFFNRTASFEFVREIDEGGKPSGRVLCSVPRGAIQALWFSGADPEEILNAKGQAIDHDMEKDVRKRVTG